MERLWTVTLFSFTSFVILKYQSGDIHIPLKSCKKWYFGLPSKATRSRIFLPSDSENPWPQFETDAVGRLDRALSSKKKFRLYTTAAPGAEIQRNESAKERKAELTDTRVVAKAFICERPRRCLTNLRCQGPGGSPPGKF